MAELMKIAGHLVNVSGAHDFEYYLEKYMGWDSLVWFQNFREHEFEELNNELEALKTEFRNYESTIESNENAFRDIEKLCREMVSEFHSETRPTKVATLRPWMSHISEILKVISNQI